jgi:hypothetical protein
MRSAPGPVEWLTFPAPDDPDRQFRVNVSFLLSNYQCIFGQGCLGSLNKKPSADYGCCERGVTFIDEDDFDHVVEMVGQLTAEDCDNIDHVRERGWYLSSKAGKPYKTRKVDSLCIFGNRTGGPAGKAGCAFHHLAARTGRHHTETKPYICWSVPLNFSSEEPEEPGGRDTTIVSAFTADAWGGTEDNEEADGRGHLGWWCIDTPDAYRGAEPVYRTMEHELRKGIGDAAYERMAELLDGIDRPRHPMPGQLVNRGLPVIGQIVAKRFPDYVPAAE